LFGPAARAASHFFEYLVELEVLVQLCPEQKEKRKKREDG
jgi:hypothetical protein